MIPAKVFFRVDASHEIGSGHVMRCLALANFLKKKNLECSFICRELPGNLIDHIKREGFLVFALGGVGGSLAKNQGYPSHSRWLGVNWQSDAQQTNHILKNHNVNWLIIDHYAIEAAWELVVKQSCDHIMVIDDLADRYHVCDILLDQNLGRSALDYAKFVTKDTLLLIGPEYALLRDEFQLVRALDTARLKRSNIKKIMISMGGVDHENITNKILDELIKIGSNHKFQLIVILGSKSPHIQMVKEKILEYPFLVELIIDCREMAKKISEVDLVIGGAGSSSWERCSLGAPSIAIILAENQQLIARALSAINAAVALNISEISSKLSEIIMRLISDPKSVELMSGIAYSVTDGLGPQRVYKSMLGIEK
jgi:UDP-2,4-diacetamido-2,4,6-trideoxy-beta-L-altropyranose hydrolase